MAIVRPIADVAAWEQWVSERPENVQEMCRKYPPDRLYRMKSTGHRCTLISYAEDGTVRVAITGQFNCLVFEREVFGVEANDLEECDLPGPPVGAMLTEDDDVRAFISAHPANGAEGK